MGKIIFFDIDGTLVGFKGNILASTRKALQAAKRNGHKILLCTGRSKNQIYPWLLEEGFQGIVAAAGAYVECDGKIIYHHTMQKEDVQKAVKEVEAELGDEGRILVRESGTEPLVRVMVEARSHEICREKVDKVVKVLREKGHVIK